MLDIIKIYDCSNSNERPKHHEENLGPVENDIMRDLKKYSKDYLFEFVPDINDAHVVITNDIFPENVLTKNNILKVKRMDGTYWQTSENSRNLILNDSAMAADLVIFISNFSKNSCQVPVKDCIVILNCANTYTFYKTEKVSKNRKFTWAACATNWDREEKRFNAIEVFSNIIADTDELYLIGKCNKILRSNVKKLGYISDDEEKAKLFNKCDAFVNFSYRDAAPKVVCQALACGLPILYANSGGVPELVNSYGIGVDIFEFDNSDGTFVPKLSKNDISYSYSKFKNHYNRMVEVTNIIKFNYRQTISDYFKIIRKKLDVF